MAGTSRGDGFFGWGTGDEINDEKNLNYRSTRCRTYTGLARINSYGRVLGNETRRSGSGSRDRRVGRAWKLGIGGQTLEGRGLVRIKNT